MSMESADKRVTMRDIARVANIPVSSVALALNNKPGVSTVRRNAVLATARVLGYESQQAVRQPVIGLLVEDLSPDAKLDGFIDSIIHGIYTAARELEVHVLLSVYHRDTNPLTDLRTMIRGEIDGMILTNGGDITTSVVQQFLDAEIPTVLVENYVDLPVDSVVADNFNAGLISTRHLLGLGHTRIGVVSGSPRYISLTDRLRGFHMAMREAGLAVPDELAPPQTPSTRPKGYEQTLALLDCNHPPTALYAVSDKSARGAYQGIAARGLVVGRDISVVSTDNVEESAYRAPGLTTFDVRARDLGQHAINLLVRRIERPSHHTRTIVPGQLIIRESASVYSPSLYMSRRPAEVRS